MTCTEVEERLPLHVYGDLTGEEAAAVAAHLNECPKCRSEAAALDRTRAALDKLATPPVRVDIAAVSVTIAERRFRRWRRLAVAGAALAACLLLAFALRLDVTVGDGRLVVAWGPASGVASTPRDSVPAQESHGALTQPRSPDFEDRLQLQEQLTRALIADLDARDRRLAGDLDVVRQQVVAVGQFAARQWADAERTMNALYVAQFRRPEEKTNP